MINSGKEENMDSCRTFDAKFLAFFQSIELDCMKLE